MPEEMGAAGQHGGRASRGPVPWERTVSSSAGQARLVEPVQQAGLALALGAQVQEPLPERSRIFLSLSEGLQIFQ